MSHRPPSSSPPAPPEDEEGATPNERLFSAAKTDNDTLLESVLKEVENVNQIDGLGNTALHYAVIYASTSILEPILCHDHCDVDIRNRLAGDTPLHIAVRQPWDGSDGLRLYLVENLLEAGADTTIRNRHNQKPIDILPPPDPSSPESDDELVRAVLRRAEAESMIAASGDVVNDDESDGEVDPDDIASD